MRKSLGAGIALAAVATHGMVSSAMYMPMDGKLQSAWTYHGFFQQIVLMTWRVWAAAHGWQSTGDLIEVNHSVHIDDFGRFYAHVVYLVCPVLGFWAFSLAGRVRAGWQWWKPMAVAIAFATPLQQVIRVPLVSAGLSEELAETIRAIAVVVLMAWSAGAITTPSWRQPDAAPQSAAA